MTQVVYGDLLLIVDFCMDFLSLCITARVLGFSKKMLRLLPAAALGGIYSVASVFLSLSALPALLVSVGVSVLMCIIAFGDRGTGRILLTLAVFFVSGALLGGMMTALFTLFGGVGGSGGQLTAVYSRVPIWLVALLAGISAVLSFFWSRAAAGVPAEGSICVKTVSSGNVSGFTVLRDSGNKLREPISGRPVIIVRQSAVCSALPPQLRVQLKNSEITEKISGLCGGFSRKLRLIPADCASGHTVYMGYIPDKTEITYTVKGKKRVCSADAVIAVDFDNRDGYDGCDGIIPEQLLK